MCSAFFLPHFLPSGGSGFAGQPRGAKLRHLPPQFLLGSVPACTGQGEPLPPARPPARCRGGVSHYFLGQPPHPALFPRLVLLAPASAFPPRRVLLGRAQPQDAAVLQCVNSGADNRAGEAVARGCRVLLGSKCFPSTLRYSDFSLPSVGCCPQRLLPFLLFRQRG